MTQSEAARGLSGAIPFVDERAIEWANVRRTRCQFFQRFHYAYPGPIANLRQRLIVIPADEYGAQRLHSYQLSVDPLPRQTVQRRDAFGNRIVELDVPQADASVSFEVAMTVENVINTAASVAVTPTMLDLLRQPTPLTRPSAEIVAMARALEAQASEPVELAQRICDWVYGVMHYESGATTVETTAADVMTLRRGLCQDYSHLALALCRSVGLASRYVSGHLLGEGGSHAWVEVLFPTGDGCQVIAFDPTNDRRPDLSYITVAVGRDYRDVSPTSGSFSAPYGGQLTSSKRAGLTLVEYTSGEVVLAS